MYHLKETHPAIVYKYNKYMQVNGTIFYAFDYLLKVLELNPESNIRWYIVIPSNLQKDYLEKLQYVFRTKYPLWHRHKDKTKLEKVKNHYGYNSEEYQSFVKKISLVNLAFDRIKLITSLELLRLNISTLLFPCWNSWYGTSLPKDINEIIVFQNREIRTIQKEVEGIQFGDIQNTSFWFETQFQQLNIKNEHKYNLKINPTQYIEKELFPILDGKPTDKITAGKPNIHTSFSENQKPSLFINVGSKIFMNTKKIDYYQNFNRFEENSRIIPEARYYNIKINVIKETAGPNINNLPFDTGIGSSKYDSSVTRLKNNLDEYILDDNDPIISKLIKG